MTKFTIFPPCHPERSGGIYSTLPIPNLQGKQLADPLHFVIPNAVVGSIERFPSQTCKPITQPDLSSGRDDKVYDPLHSFIPNAVLGSIIRLPFQTCQAITKPESLLASRWQSLRSFRFIIPNAVVIYSTNQTRITTEHPTLPSHDRYFEWSIKS